jgi:hypothetical protein
MSIANTYSPNAPTGKTNTGSAVSNREDLSSELTILAPEDTPLLTLCPKIKASGTFYEWTVDSLSAPVTTGISEGADVTAFTNQFQKRGRLGNYVQIFRDDFVVSDLQQAVTSVGPANIAQAEAKSMRQLKRNIEATIASDNEMSVENGAGTPYATRGLGKWLQNAAQAVNPVPTDYRTPTGSIKASTLAETDLSNLIGSIFSVNGEMNSLTLIAGAALRRTVSNFTRSLAATNNTYHVSQEATSKKVTLSVELYETDFGLLRVMNANPACQATGTGYVINPKYLGFASLIPMGATRLENQGGGERGFVDATGALVCRHPGAHGKITSIS